MGKRVLVLRAVHQASALAERLREHGLEPVLLPAIEVVDPVTFEPLDAALAELSTFDWLLFSSANAVDAVARRTRGAPLGFTGKVAAIGPGTARSLARLGLVADLVPPQAVAESFAETMLGEVVHGGPHQERFLLIRAEDGRDHLPEMLRAAGAEVVVVAAYRTVVPEGSVRSLRELLATHAPLLDAITFTSSSSVRNFLVLCQAAAVQLPSAALRVSIGPITSETMAAMGIPADAEAPEATVAALAATTAWALAGTARAAEGPSF